MKTIARDPREAPAYTYADAARFVHVPVATLRSWVTGRGYSTNEGPAHFRRLIVPASRTHLSFINLVEGHVLKGIRRNHGVPMKTIRPALDYVARELEVEHPLARESFETDGMDLFVRRLGQLLNASRCGQFAMQSVMAVYLRRIEHGADGLAWRFFPFTRTANESDQPHQIVINPGVMWGRPVIAGTRIDTKTVIERFRAGETAAEIAEDFDLLPEQVDEAVRSELTWAA